MLPRLASGDANKGWIIPSELNDALKGLGQASGSENVREYVSKAAQQFSAPPKVDVHAEIEAQAEKDRERSNETVEKAIADAKALEQNKQRRMSGAAAPALTQRADNGPVQTPAQAQGQPQPTFTERPDFQ